MNERYRKQMRLKSRHHRRGHTPFCNCPEMWQALALAMRRRLSSGVPLARRTVRRVP